VWDKGKRDNGTLCVTPAWRKKEITDAQTGELLAAAVDKRMGGRTLASAETSWTDVNNILAYWAQLTRFRLCEQQGRAGCAPPQTGGL
jgi:hypothetical protein